ncbi:Uncharacterised protein [Streptococcus pneumoniae]|nr:Uncharacterised protein [Streptococcus pneumoniae]CVY32901.1 Uncharacterised protein [Streptococcus pneumoniae]CWE71238.1 Uncharacterised protein [Streptococcus pneumoniae]CWK70878.1 Uncharacterised protein [Streptococcus pneumoniae]
MRFYCEAYEVITEEKKVYFNRQYLSLCTFAMVFLI